MGSAMTNANQNRKTPQKLAIFRACFSGLEHAYGTYNPRTGQVTQVKEAVTDQVLLDHLLGRRPYGVYLLTAEVTRAVVADFDHEEPDPGLHFVRQARQYGLRAYLERSKRKGWHAWIFADTAGVSAAKARLVVKAILADIGAPHTEVFPKQDRLTSDTSYGNFINAPLWGPLVPQGRTVFVDVEQEFRPYPNQWDLLKGVQRVTEAQLDQIIEMNDLAVSSSTSHTGTARSCAAPPSSFGLPPCAQKMLAQGVADHQRVACFRLAVHLKKAGMPQDITLACLRSWAGKNRPADCKSVICEEEIVAQVTWAYERNYRGCGCEEPAVAPFCDPACALHVRSQGTPQGQDDAALIPTSQLVTFESEERHVRQNQ